MQHDTLKKDQPVQQINREKHVDKCAELNDKSQSQKAEINDSKKKNSNAIKKEKNESLMPKKGCQIRRDSMYKVP